MSSYKQVKNNQLQFTKDENRELIKQNVKILVNSKTKQASPNKQNISNDFLQSFVSYVPTATSSSPLREDRSLSSKINIKSSNSKLSLSKIKFNSPLSSKKELPLMIKNSINRIYYDELEKRQLNLEALKFKYYPNQIKKKSLEINKQTMHYDETNNQKKSNMTSSIYENRRKLHKFLDTEYYLSKTKIN
jgi:hypothetical protein